MFSLQEKAIIWLNTFEGIYAQKQLQLLGRFSDAEEFVAKFGASFELLKSCLDEKQFRLMAKSLAGGGIDKAVEEALSFGATPITLFSENYPKTLKEIAVPPTVLYCLGDISLLESKAIAVVGSRKCSQYGETVTKNFVADLVRNGYAIISGMALGIDGAAHRAAMKCGGKTIAVLGGGFSKIYPPQHESLFKEIAAKGLVITEFAPKISSQAFHFPLRNRLISGLSDGVLMVEAGLKSGTFNTIGHATEQGKDIFIVPGEIYSPYCVGSNEILKAIPHSLVTSARDIVEAQRGTWFDEGKKPVPMQLSVEERMISNFLSDGVKNFDEILDNVKLSVSLLQTCLSKMEIAGIVEKQSGNYYKLLLEEFA